MILIIITILLMSIFAWRMYRQSNSHPLIRFYWPLLWWKLIIGLFYAVLYVVYYEGKGDTLFLHWHLSRLYELLMIDPEHFSDLYFYNSTNDYQFEYLVTYQPRVWFFTKLVFPLFLLCDGNYWILTVLFSFISFICLWSFAAYIIKKFSAAKSAVVFVLFILPSFTIFTSGFSKETIAFCFIAWSIMLLMGITELKWEILWKVPLLLLLFWMLWELKFYYAAVLMVFSMAIIWKEFLYKKFGSTYKGKVRGALLLLIILIILLPVIASSNYYLSFDNLAVSIYENYKETLRLAQGRNCYEFAGFEPSLKSVLLWFVPAAVNGLTGPFPWSETSTMALGAVFENSILYILIFSSLYFVAKRKITLGYYGVVILFYSTVLAGFLALASPNWGALMRYKIAFLPFLYLMFSAYHPWFVKADNFFFGKK